MPEGLYTRAQLSRMDPPHRVRRGVEPAATALHRLGRRYVPLWRVEDTEVRSPGTPAQRESAAHARDIQQVCRICGVRDEFRLGRGRLCTRCRQVVSCWYTHQRARDDANHMLSRVTAFAAAVPTGDGGARFAAVDTRYQVLVSFVADADCPPAERRRLCSEAGARILAPEAPNLLWWSSREEQTARDMFAVGEGDGWDLHGVNARDVYARWWGEWEGDVPHRMRCDVPCPDAGGVDAVADARAVMDTLRRVALDCAPVCPDAPWVGVPGRDLVAAVTAAGLPFPC